MLASYHVITSKPCKQETCPECRPLQQAATSNTEAARCIMASFPYQCHFDGYIEISKVDAALFWEADPDPESNLWSEKMDLAPHSEKAPPVESIGLKR